MNYSINKSFLDGESLESWGDGIISESKMESEKKELVTPTDGSVSLDCKMDKRENIAFMILMAFKEESVKIKSLLEQVD